MLRHRSGDSMPHSAPLVSSAHQPQVERVLLCLYPQTIAVSSWKSLLPSTLTGLSKWDARCQQVSPWFLWPSSFPRWTRKVDRFRQKPFFQEPQPSEKWDCHKPRGGAAMTPWHRFGDLTFRTLAEWTLDSGRGFYLSPALWDAHEVSPPPPPAFLRAAMSVSGVVGLPRYLTSRSC